MKKDKNVPSVFKLFDLSGYYLAAYTLSLPLFGFITCVIISVIYDFERSTATHCGVKNYLPSISSAIGGFTPQRYIWRICIALHIAPRFLVAASSHNYLNGLTPQSKAGAYGAGVKLATCIHLFELIALLMLTTVSSSENYGVHEASFIMFMACSLVYMLFNCILIRWGHSRTGMSERVAKAYRLKKIFFISNLTAFMVAVYFFYRHNTYCEPGVYTLFALAEYITVATNICFHGSITGLIGHGRLTYIVNDSVKKVP